ncbi:Asp23/Gls24 family envelope stress response protein [Megasphaera sp. SW808]|uniref:Asp23/Gls24 family envelope stress response protein n=1 Tax=Megasphaera sp. SW808 TaxID=2530045 RepID=UPI00143C58CE|nr:Asp23/Gls24 family envelope stress response protein [Megasphaera sp. SW808]
MTEHSDSFAYTISESALAKIAATAVLGTKGVAGKKGRGIVVKYLDGIVVADVHIQAYYGVQLRTLALTVQQNVAKALTVMADPKHLEVHVTIEDVVMSPHEGQNHTGG